MNEYDACLLKILKLALDFNATVVMTATTIISSVDNREKIIPTEQVMKQFNDLSKKYEKELKETLTEYEKSR